MSDKIEYREFVRHVGKYLKVGSCVVTGKDKDLLVTVEELSDKLVGSKDGGFATDREEMIARGMGKYVVEQEEMNAWRSAVGHVGGDKFKGLEEWKLSRV